MKIYLSGFGAVSCALIELILNNQVEYKARYQLDLQVVGVIGREGLLEDQNGLDLDGLLQNESGSRGVLAYAESKGISLQTDFMFSGDLLIECTPSHHAHGEPGYTYMKQALHDGLDVVTVSKGALLHHFTELMGLAASKNKTIKFSGAVAAALPTYDMADYCLAGTTITELAAVLNGTSNFVLSHMMDSGVALSESLQRAQELGIAEANPEHDIEGFDSASKLVILANSMFGGGFHLDDVSIQGITSVTQEDVEDATQKGYAIRLVARATHDAKQLVLSVKPEWLIKDHPLATVHGTNKGIIFNTQEMGEIIVSGGASSPVGAASAALKDIINLKRKNK
ncbi:homoserine dehydrogenase [Alkalihalobacillus sp. NPDC078783]